MSRVQNKVCLGIVIALLSATLVGCGGGGNSQTTGTLEGVSVTPATVSLPLGTTRQLTATGTYSGGGSKDLTSQVAWSVSPAGIATVSSSGLLTTQAKGSATVSATMTAFAGQANVTVQAAALSSIQISPSSPKPPLGTTQQMTATATYTDGTTQDITNSVTWSASPASVIVMVAPGQFHAVGKGQFSMTATAGSTTQTINGSVVNAVVQSLQVNPGSASIPAGTTQLFTASSVYSDGTTQDVTSSTTWGSTNAGVAGVIGGLATAGAQGSTQITASYETFTGGASLSVSGATVKSIQVSPAALSLAKGTSQQLTATATLTDGSSQNVSSSVTWASSATSVCSVSTSGTVTAVGVGSCSVTATSGLISGASAVTVTSATLISITITPPNVSVNVGGNLQITATGTFSDGTTQNVTGSVTFGSSKPLIAGINTGGLLLGLAPGTSTITASLGAVSSTFNVTVTAATLQSLSLGIAPVTIAAGISTKLTATGSFSDGSTQDLSATVSWSTSASAVATVDATGNVAGLGVGSATITATLGAVSGTLGVTVNPATIVSISVTPGSVTIAAGQSQIFTASATLTDGSNLDVTASAHWSVTNPLLANISNSLGTAGQLTSLLPGSSTVSASVDSVTGTADLYVSAATLTGISVGPSGLSLALGVPANLTASGSFSDGSTEDITALVQWSSSNGQAVSVSGGLVTPIAIGSANITASMSGVSGSVGVNVTAAVLDSINLSAINALALGLTQQLKAIGNYSDGTVQDITSVVHWSSSNTGIVSVSAGGLLLGLGAGNASVTAALGSVNQTAPVSVSAAILQSIAVTAPQNSFALGFTLQLTATGTYSDGSTEDLSAAVSWSSSNNSIALVSATGLTSGLLAGGVSATATLQGVSGSLAVTVNSATLVSISISPNPVTIAGLLLSQQLTLTGHFSDGSTQVITAGAHWSCTNALLGSVNASGLLTALGLGNLNAVATFGGFTATVSVQIL